jgi:hypothetical protein
VVVINGIYLVINHVPGIDALVVITHVPGGDAWFGVQMLLGGLALLVLGVGDRLPRAHVVAALAALIVVASLHNGIRVLGHTSSQFYPSRLFARTAAITYAEAACRGHRTLLLDDALPRNVGDVFRRLRTQNGYGATLHEPFFAFTTAGSWTSPEQTRLLDLRCILARKPLDVPGYTARFHDIATGVTVYVDDRTSPVNTPDLKPIPVTVLESSDRHLRYAVDLTRPETVVISAIAYPGWRLQVDGRAVKTDYFRSGKAPIFPQVSLRAGRHTLDYRWSGWPA